MLDKAAMNDSRLPFRAKGLYAYLMSRPDGAYVSIDDLAHHGPGEDGEEIRRDVQALFDAGYLLAEDGPP